MSDSPNPHSQSSEVASVAATLDLSHEVEFKLSDYQWQNRILLVFAPSTDSSQYRQQMQAWQADEAGTGDRDLKLVQILGTGESQVDGRSLSSASAVWHLLIALRFALWTINDGLSRCLRY